MLSLCNTDARIEFWYLGAFAGYSSQKNVAVMPNGRCFTKDEMYSVWDRTYVDVSFRLSDILKKLDVTHEELILMKAICLTSAGKLLIRCGTLCFRHLLCEVLIGVEHL